jgi:hypothetical protein
VCCKYLAVPGTRVGGSSSLSTPAVQVVPVQVLVTGMCIPSTGYQYNFHVEKFVFGLKCGTGCQYRFYVEVKF